MLVIGRKRGQKLIIDGDIEITVLKVGRNHVKFGINAPRHVRIHTREGTGASADASGESGPKVREIAIPLEESPPSPPSDPASTPVTPPDRPTKGSAANAKTGS